MIATVTPIRKRLSKAWDPKTNETARTLVQQIIAMQDERKRLSDDLDEAKSKLRTLMLSSDSQRASFPEGFATFEPAFVPYCRCCNEPAVTCKLARLPETIFESHLVECEPWLKVKGVA